MKFFKFNFQGKISSIYYQARQHWVDILIVIVLGTAGSFASYQGAKLIDPIIFNPDLLNVWFEADIPRVFANMTDSGSDHYRTKVHPLFSLIAFPPVYVLKNALLLEPVTAVRSVFAAVAFLWIGTLFILLRLIGCQRFDATLFSLLAATSASAVFWFVVPETYPFGSLSILLALCFVVIAQHRKLSTLWYVVVSALTLSFTITNWIAGILATIVNNSWKRSLQITANAFCLVVLLWSVQKFLFPSAEFFIGDREERGYMSIPDTFSELPEYVQSFVSGTMVMPGMKLVDNLRQPDWPVLDLQTSFAGSGSSLGAIAVVLWTTLLGLGLWALFSVRQHRRLRLVLGLILLGQLALHSLYGRSEVFLYSLHFAPLLVVLAAFSTLTRARPLALVLASMLVLSAGVNNSKQFSKAIEFFQSQKLQSYQVNEILPMTVVLHKVEALDAQAHNL